MKLRRGFQPIRSNILNKEILLDINVVFRELIHVETHIYTLVSINLSYTIYKTIDTPKGNHKPIFNQNG